MTTRPITDKQQAEINRLFRKAVQNDDDQWTYAERVAEALGFVDEHGVDLEAYAAALRNRDLSSREASIQITILTTMANEQRCTGYCGQRGVQHSHVHYCDGHYDYECGLS